MALTASTAKALARVMMEEINDQEVCLNILRKWQDVRGTNGNFRFSLADIEPFIKKVKTDKKEESSEEPTE